MCGWRVLFVLDRLVWLEWPISRTLLEVAWSWLVRIFSYSPTERMQIYHHVATASENETQGARIRKRDNKATRQNVEKRNQWDRSIGARDKCNNNNSNKTKPSNECYIIVSYSKARSHESAGDIIFDRKNSRTLLFIVFFFTCYSFNELFNKLSSINLVS